MHGSHLSYCSPGIQTEGRRGKELSFVIPAAMALPANKAASLTLSVVQLVLLLVVVLFSAPSFSVHARSIRSHGRQIQSNWEDKGQEALFWYYMLGSTHGRKYQTYSVLLWTRPNGGEAAMDDDDDRDARRRWYESFLPSTLTDSGDPRLIDCYTSDANGFLARLTRDEARDLAKKPAVRRMDSDYFGPFITTKGSCGFQTTVSMKTKRPSFLRSRPAF